MSSFQKEYAEIYDLLYPTKDYNSECNLIDATIKKYKPDVKSIMDYGCGTGNHAGLLAQKGYTLYGIDRNEHMLNIARKKLAGKPNVHLYLTDERDKVAAGAIGAVLTLFDVISYMNSNEEVNNFLQYVKKVLAKDGLFIFDFWYGPGVINLKPEKRWKEHNFGAKKILRLTSPEHDTLNCIVNVTHDVIMFENDEIANRLLDTHHMRYFFKNEIELFLEQQGFEVLKFGTWENIDSPPTERDWSVLTIARKR